MEKDCQCRSIIFFGARKKFYGTYQQEGVGTGCPGNAGLMGYKKIRKISEKIRKNLK